MYNQLEQRLNSLQPLTEGLLTRGRRVGLEKESLRVGSDGGIALSDHPKSLGSALTNPYITTDYSEALLEFVTPPVADVETALHFLDNAHQFVYPRLPDSELIWATSMPCVVNGADSIRIGEYGSSNAGKMKHAYRRGLGLRYGKIMQTIAGVHFNYSYSSEFWKAYQSSIGNSSAHDAFVTDSYFQMTRNLLRYGWLVPYLFGASPAICRSFLNGADPLPGMKTYKNDSYYEPFGTSLRMGDIGYQYAKDSKVPIKVSYENVDSYVADLRDLITTRHDGYTELGLKDAAGDYQQLNVNSLQIENEYYSSVRPKQIAEGNEMPLLAMARRGIQYLELRSVDVNLFEPLGVSASQLHFLETFMLFSLLHQSDSFGSSDVDRLSRNMSLTAHRGRDPALELRRSSGSIGLGEWGTELLSQMVGPAELLDKHTRTANYTASLADQSEKMTHPEMTPSARMLREMHEQHDSYYALAKTWSVRHGERFIGQKMSASDSAIFQSAAKESLLKQSAMESADTLSFDEYLAKYFSQLSESDLNRRRNVS